MCIINKTTHLESAILVVFPVSQHDHTVDNERTLGTRLNHCQPRPWTHVLKVGLYAAKTKQQPQNETLNSFFTG